MIHTGEPLNIGDAIHSVQEAAAYYSDTPRLDAHVLLSHLTGKPRSWILAHPEEPFPAALSDSLLEACARLREGVPLPYTLGSWEFFGIDFELTPSALIPRPETELLVETAIQWLGSHPQSSQAADIGTGSGCIAISMALKVPNLQIIATDLSVPALEIARSNAARHEVSAQVNFIQADLFTPLDGSLPLSPSCFDLIVANLPYIPTDTLRMLDVFEREPTLALDGGPDGLHLVRQLLADAARFLKPDGLILLEIEAHQGKIAIELAKTHFPQAACSLVLDLGGRDRLLRIQT